MQPSAQCNGMQWNAKAKPPEMLTQMCYHCAHLHAPRGVCFSASFARSRQKKERKGGKSKANTVQWSKEKKNMRTQKNVRTKHFEKKRVPRQLTVGKHNL
ncbi:hypothetical protein O6H91_03G066400 [Diphasiastrum complanatum]|uniref:Uncharacterized protein n=1 Tax=Diphasiastrum complanatum TaxID=34168 RepID=A0ACC2E7A3_DIPCM|nr:hypothetical protein O6H91_03G066400 [Diphasiastrum complanatum]